MSAGSNILQPYQVAWNDFDSAFACIDNPDIGIALMEEPGDTPSAASLLIRLENIGRTTPGVKRIVINQCTSPDTVDVTMKSESGANTNFEIADDFNHDLVAALGISVTIRREIISRLASVCTPDVVEALQPYDTAETFSPRHDNNPMVKSRIDYMDPGTATVESIPNLHCDATILTEHGGATKPALKIVIPGTNDLTAIDIPPGYRLLSRGIHWQLARSPEYVPLFHSADPKNVEYGRARWVLLWRAHKMINLIADSWPQQLEDCREAREDRQSLIRAV